MIEGSFTVTFEHPYWVGIVERFDERGYAVAKVIYGSEPDHETVLHTLKGGYLGLQFSEPVAERPPQLHEMNYKRRQRELKRMLEAEPGVSETAREALHEERKRQAEERHKAEKAAHEAEEERKFRLRQEKNKEKKRGH